jgi:hypothetical protein
MEDTYCSCGPEEREPEGEKFGEKSSVRCANCRGIIWE